MGADTKIEWADHTFNPWVGCAKVSPACDHCYAEGWARRTGQGRLWHGDRRRTSASNWQQPHRWNRAAAAAGRRDRVFCASLADVFDNQVPEVWRDDLWLLIADTPHLDWLLLTKRPQNIAKMLPGMAPNVWLGTTVENQEEADRRIPALLEVPAHRRFLSCEPLLGPVDLLELPSRFGGEDRPLMRLNALRGVHHCGPAVVDAEARVDWVIAGGESGPDARPMHPDWARSLRDQCQAAGVAFHFKQWGEWAPWWDGAPLGNALLVGKGEYRLVDGARRAQMTRVGKARAGRELDGRTWDEVPA